MDASAVDKHDWEETLEEEEERGKRKLKIP